MGTEIAMSIKWGTWEELLLGGAVLRHGTHNWVAVASELSARSIYPYSFTPEICKEKYVDLQQRYFGCPTWFDELRKQRMEELRQALEESENSIDSLELRLECLKAGRGARSLKGFNYHQSFVPSTKFDGPESSGRETSKDGLSASSFTKEAQINWSPEVECRLPSKLSSADCFEANPECECSERGKSSDCIKSERAAGFLRQANVSASMQFGEPLHHVKRMRGKRRRSGNGDVREGSVEESDISISGHDSISQSKERCLQYLSKDAGTSAIISTNDVASRDVRFLMGFLDSIMENENAHVFRHRLDSQTSSKYNKLVRHHVDFGIIRSKLCDHSISSAKELFRDLLLLVNNALIFYPRKSQEHKSAILLRDLIMKKLSHYLHNSYSRTNILFVSTFSLLPVKPRSVRSWNSKSTTVGNDRKILAGTADGGNESGSGKDTVSNLSPMLDPKVKKKMTVQRGKKVTEVAPRHSESMVRNRTGGS